MENELEKEIQHWKDKAIANHNMLVDISNIIEEETICNIQIEKIKNIYTENGWKI